MRARRGCVLLVVAALAGCGGSERSGGSASCAATVQWRSSTYWGYATAKHAPIGRPLGRGVIPACDDTNGTNAVGRDEPVRIRAIRGVDPRLAIVTQTRPPTVYINGPNRNSSEARALLRRLGRRG